MVVVDNIIFFKEHQMDHFGDEADKGFGLLTSITTSTDVLIRSKESASEVYYVVQS